MSEEEVKANLTGQPTSVHIGPLKWPLETDVPLLYTNFFAFQRTENEAVLTFGEFMPVLQHPLDERSQEYLEEPNIRVVARIALSHVGLESFFNMLKRNLDAGDDDEPAS